MLREHISLLKEYSEGRDNHYRKHKSLQTTKGIDGILSALKDWLAKQKEETKDAKRTLEAGVAGIESTEAIEEVSKLTLVG